MNEESRELLEGLKGEVIFLNLKNGDLVEGRLLYVGGIGSRVTVVLSDSVQTNEEVPSVRIERSVGYIRLVDVESVEY